MAQTLNFFKILGFASNSGGFGKIHCEKTAVSFSSSYDFFAL
jgi:hypothetical protein